MIYCYFTGIEEARLFFLIKNLYICVMKKIRPKIRHFDLNFYKSFSRIVELDNKWMAIYCLKFNVANPKYYRILESEITENGDYYNVKVTAEKLQNLKSYAKQG